jgi:hypothetical protein
MRNYLVTLTKGGRSYFVSASSAESAKQIVLDFEPYYNPELLGRRSAAAGLFFCPLRVIRTIVLEAPCSLPSSC